jgi:hypothetical protein
VREFFRAASTAAPPPDSFPAKTSVPARQKRLAHELQSNHRTRSNPFMNATKIKTLQDIRGIHPMPGRAVLPRPAGLFLTPMGATLTIGCLSQPRFVIPVMTKGQMDSHAQPVKITHLR